ncbi:DUF5994 family protein [Spirillospora sp. NBC_01491]|uniref:DUF5994 family protein n=1 Tax=Spirillospora sp. NBC_01491 TaxID=2976007 RepID=UPI002E3761C5|nr:DUF5994 family protein [Spirillospora sp. NBC_01491]
MARIYDLAAARRSPAPPGDEPAGPERAREPRLTLAPGPERRGALDGGWWPRSRDAVAELTALVGGLPWAPDEPLRLTVDLADWDEVPRRLLVGGRMIKVGWLPDIDSMVIVTRGRSDELMLLVVPPEAPEAPARAALASAAAGTDSAMPHEILAACDVSTARVPGPDGRSDEILPTGAEDIDRVEPIEISQWADDGGMRRERP